MTKKEKTGLTLVVRYPSGREDYATISDGRFVVGSDGDCDIVVAETSVEPRHVRITSKRGALEVENLSATVAIWLNETPLARRETAPFLFGDRLRVGSAVLSVQEPYCPGPDKAQSPDGARQVRQSVVRDVRAGWLGYRRVLEKLAGFISRDEAQAASAYYKSGLRVFFWSLAVLAAGNLIASLLEFEQWYRTSAVLSLCLQFCSNAAILVLAGCFRMAFAGRVLYPVMFLAQCNLMTPSVPCEAYWSDSWTIGLWLALAFSLGWLMDYGAGFVFEERRRNRMFRFLFLLLPSCLSVALMYANERIAPTPLSFSWGFLAEAPCLLWLFVCRRVLAVNARIPADAQFVAEIAMRRAWKRTFCQGLSLALVVLPCISVLLFLGEDEHRQWPTDDPDVLWTDESTKNEAWFWKDRGRYFKKSDLNANLIYQVPISLLATPATSNEWERMYSACKRGAGDESSSSVTNELFDLAEKITNARRLTFKEENEPLPEEGAPEFDAFLESFRRAGQDFVLSDFATDMCARVHAIAREAQDVASYESLCAMLSSYRVTSSNFVPFAQSLGLNSVCVFCESIDRHPEYGKAPSAICTARFRIGVEAYTPGRLEEVQKETDRRKTGVLLVIVLAALALLVLYRRGADSQVGFWLGLWLFSRVFLLTETIVDFGAGISECVKYEIWHGAFTNPLYAMLAVWLSTAFGIKDVFEIFSFLAVSVLFVALCWPSAHGDGKWKRRLVFWGKILLVFVMMSVLEVVFLVYVTASVLALGVIEVLLMGLVGWLLRRHRRHYTEAPHLGFHFFIGCLAFVLAINVFTAWQGLDFARLLDSADANQLRDALVSAVRLPIVGLEVEWGRLLSFALPLFALVCWIWFLLRQRFLNVLSLGGITLITVVFVIPLVLHLVGENLAVDLSDSFLISGAGMQLVSAIAIVTLAPAALRFLQKLGRRVFLRNVYRMEQDVAKAIEKIFDESANRSESVYNVLSCMKIETFAFYERVSKDGFELVVSKNWTEQIPRTLSPSEPLRARLGRKRELIDFKQLPFRQGWFFVSFELWRMHLETQGALLLPICLGTSVRGLLFVGAAAAADMPTDHTLVASINSFGLSALTPR